MADLADAVSLAAAFDGADAVYVLNPPAYAMPDIFARAGGRLAEWPAALALPLQPAHDRILGGDVPRLQSGSHRLRASRVTSPARPGLARRRRRRHRARDVKTGVVRRALQVARVALGRLLIPWMLRRGGATGAERVQAALEELGGTWIKLGQALALRFDLLPEEYCLRFFQLLNQVQPFPPEEVRRNIERELGRPVEALFRSFEWTPLATASIGQVHRAELGSVIGGRHDRRDLRDRDAARRGQERHGPRAGRRPLPEGGAHRGGDGGLGDARRLVPLAQDVRRRVQVFAILHVRRLPSEAEASHRGGYPRRLG